MPTLSVADARGSSAVRDRRAGRGAAVLAGLRSGGAGRYRPLQSTPGNQVAGGDDVCRSEAALRHTGSPHSSLSRVRAEDCAARHWRRRARQGDHRPPARGEPGSSSSALRHPRARGSALVHPGLLSSRYRRSVRARERSGLPATAEAQPSSDLTGIPLRNCERNDYFSRIRSSTRFGRAPPTAGSLPLRLTRQFGGGYHTSAAMA